MPLDEDKRTFEELIVDFCDEDTATWTIAAGQIGRRAAGDAECLGFLRRRLDEAPAAAEGRGKPTGYQDTALRAHGDAAAQPNLHRFRHACCAMASYLSEPNGDEKTFAETLDQVIRQPLLRLCVEAMQDEGGTVGELKKIPTIAGQFDDWRASQLDAARKNVEKFQDGGNPAALEASRDRLRALEQLTDDSPVPAGFKPKLAATKFFSEWSLACYLAGVRTKKALLALPLELLVRSLLWAAKKRRGSGLPYVLSLPRLLKNIKHDVPAKQWSAAAAMLFENVSKDWAGMPDQFNEYLVQLCALPGAPGFRDVWDRPFDLPDRLGRELDAIEAMVDSPQGAEEAARLAGRTMRRIAEETFGDDWRWKERSTGEQFALNVYTLLMIHGPGALRGGRQDPTESPQNPQLDLRHRIALLIEGIGASGRARGTILPPLVRCLKVLLNGELAEFSARLRRRGRGNYETLQELMTLGRGQLLMVKPLLRDWLLPGTLRKDLAAIVCRILHKVYRFQQQHRDQLEDDRKEYREYAVELVYTILFAFPDNLLLREMIEYSTDDDLCRLLDCIRQLIERFEEYDQARALLTGETQRRAYFRIESDNWKAHYKDFATLLSCISLHSLSADSGRHWLNHLRDMVDHLTRSGEAGSDHAAAESPFQPILLYGQKSQQDWRELFDQAKGRREDRTGAREERNERQSRLDLAARAAASDFMGLLDDIQILENDCLPEVGRPRMADDLVPRWRRLIARMTELGRLCNEQLPWLERVLCTRIINHRINDELEPRLQRIVEIVDQEREDDARAVLERHVLSRADRADDQPAARLDEGESKDVGLIENWMLRRYMIRELAETYRLRVLTWLTNWRFVMGWILLPFLACGVLNLFRLGSWSGIPFAVVCLGNFALLLAFAAESRRRRPRLGQAMASPWGFLLPQTAAAIFLAIFTSIASDEGWALAVKSNLPVQFITWVVFLVVGFLFTREIILAGQFRSRKQAGRKNRRARELMALSLWQSFTLVMFFAIAAGKIMAGDTRGVINPEEFEGLGRAAARIIPVEVYLGSAFLQPACDRAGSAFWIFPRAILSWTVQMFFFGAIFERVMRRQGDN